MMNDWWDRYDFDPSNLDNIYEREFGDDSNPLNQLYEDDDDESDPHYQIHHNQQTINSQTQLTQDSQHSISHSNSYFQTHSQSQSHLQSTTTIQNTNNNQLQQNEKLELNCKNFKLAKLIMLLQQMDMVNPVTSCLMAIVALIFGICWIISMYGNFFSSIM